MNAGAIRDDTRASLSALLEETSPSDALASYYALHHDRKRTDIFLHPTHSQPLTGFLVRARTGMDLFRPLVTFRADSEEAARSLFQRGIPADRPVYLSVPERMARWSNKLLDVTEVDLHRVYRHDPRRYEPSMNVLVVASRDEDNLPRCVIRHSDRPGAVAGVNWMSDRFAEVFVYTLPALRGRGWGKAVVSTLVGMIMQDNRIPLYVVAESNQYSIRLAESIGFEDTGYREYAGQAVRSSSPPDHRPAPDRG